jgi:hypothetical protein
MISWDHVIKAHTERRGPKKGGMGVGRRAVGASGGAK